jgi:hypothetical protein
MDELARLNAASRQSGTVAPATEVALPSGTAPSIHDERAPPLRAR